jgi:hypothetical protein
MWTSILSALGSILAKLLPGLIKTMSEVPRETVEVKEAPHVLSENPTAVDADALRDNIIERSRLFMAENKNSGSAHKSGPK